VLATLIPLVAFSLIIIAVLWRQNMASVERGLRDTARAQAFVVQREMEAAIGPLEGLARSEYLDRGHFRAFYDEARRVARGHPTWSTVLLMDPAGQQLLNLRRPFGTPLPDLGAVPTTRRLASTGTPTISGLTVAPLTGGWSTGIGVVVTRGGVVKYLLVAAIDQDRWAQLLARQDIPAEWFGAIVDQNGIVVARTRGQEYVGKAATEEYRVRSAEAAEGVLKHRTLEGVPVYVSWARVPIAGWSVSLAVPTELVEAPPRRLALWAGGAGLVAILIAVVLATLLARRIRRPITDLARAAGALGRGEAIVMAPAPVREVAMAATALQQAGALLESRAREDETRRRTAEALAEVGKTLTQSLDTGLVAQRVVDSVRAVLRARAVGLHVVDATGAMPTIAVSGDVTQTWALNVVYPPGAGTIGLAVRERRVVVTGDSLGDARIWYPADIAARIAQASYRSLLAVPLIVHDRVIGVLGVGDILGREYDATDVDLAHALADQAAVALENARLYQDAEQRRQEAETANRAKDEFLAMLGHELRNPLGAIANAVGVLDRTRDDAEVARRAHEIIDRQVNHLARLVDDLLDVGRVVTGKIVLERRPLDLAAAVSSAVSTLVAGAPPGPRVVLETSPVWIDADTTRVEQVAVNLVSNALKYTPSHGTVRVSVARDGEHAVLRVQDDGIGMSPELLARVFDLFVQGDRSLDRAPGGLGIGLTLVRRLVELHGGTVAAASDGPGRGAVFTVRLPAVAPPDKTDAANGRPAPAAHRRVVIVEDNDDAREMLRHLLEMSGHEVHEARDGPAGVGLALAVRPDVVLIDLGLPGLDGYAVARSIRAQRGQTIRLVAITGYGLPDDQRRTREAGFDVHLVKPVDPAELTGALR